MLQDWEQVTWKKTDPVVQHHSEGEVAVREMTYSIQKAIQQSRLACKMSQKELAKQLNVTTNVIVDYENGKAVPNNAFIAKMEKIMNTKLPISTKKKLIV